MSVQKVSEIIIYKLHFELKAQVSILNTLKVNTYTLCTIPFLRLNVDIHDSSITLFSGVDFLIDCHTGRSMWHVFDK